MAEPATDARNRRKEIRRIELLEAAFALFVARGFATTRLEDVAAQAGVAKGTVVSYFPTKEALFTAVVLHHLEPQVRHAEMLLSASGTPRERLVRMVRFLHDSLCDPHLGAIPKLIVSEVAGFPELARTFHAQVCQRFAHVQSELIRQGIAAGEFREVDAEACAKLLTEPLLMQAIFRHSLGRYETDPIDPERHLAAHLDVFLRGIART